MVPYTEYDKKSKLEVVIIFLQFDVLHRFFPLRPWIFLVQGKICPFLFPAPPPGDMRNRGSDWLKENKKYSWKSI